jgi:tRNA_anti-like
MTKTATMMSLMLLALAAANAHAQEGTPVPARQIVQAYTEDGAAARAKYAGKPIVVTGAVRRINLGQFGRDNMILDGENISTGLLVTLAEGVSAKAVTVGQTVVLRCVMEKENMYGGECRFAGNGPTR